MPLLSADVLALAGSELALVSNLSAYTMSTPWILYFVTSRRGLFANRVAMVLGGMASWILPNPFSRLLAVSIGTWCGWLALLGNWTRLKGSKEMIAEGQGELGPLTRFDVKLMSSLRTGLGDHHAP